MKLFCPGPVNLSEALKNTSCNEISHRSESFQTLFAECSKLTLQLFRADSSFYLPLFLTGSGSLAIESIVYALHGKSVLLLQNGFFSEKWEQLLLAHNISYSVYKKEWGQPFDIESLFSIYSEKPFTSIFMVHHETSTTMINELEEIDEFCKRNNVDLVVDAVSSAGLYTIDLSKCTSISYLGFSTNKCIGSNPGLAVVLAKKSNVEQIPSTLSYLNLKLYAEFSKQSETPFTPCVQNFFFYQKALQEVLSQTGRKDYYERLSSYFVSKMTELGFVPFVTNPRFQCCWVINFSCKDPFSFYKFLYEKGVVVYKCKSFLQKSYIQVAILNKTQEDIDEFVNLCEHYKKSIEISTIQQEDLAKLEE